MGRPSNPICVLKDREILWTAKTAKEISMKLGMSAVVIYQYIREGRVTKDGLYFKHAADCKDMKQSEKPLTQDEKDEDLEFYVPDNKKEAREMLTKFIESKLGTRWRNIPLKKEKMERRFVRLLMERI